MSNHPIKTYFSNLHPLAKFFDFDFIDCQKKLVVTRLVAPQTFANPNNINQIHSGYLTIALDSLMGGTVFGALDEFQTIATVNLSINHLRKPMVGEALIARTTCDSFFQDMAYVNGIVISEKTSEKLADAIGTFMIGTRNTSIRNLDREKTNG